MKEQERKEQELKEQDRKEFETFIKENDYVWNWCIEDYDTYIKNIEEDFNEYKNCQDPSKNKACFDLESDKSENPSEDLVDYNSEEVKRIIRIQKQLDDEDEVNYKSRYDISES